MQLTTLGELEAELTELAAHLHAGEYRWLKLLAEFDRRQGWSVGGFCSCSHWMGFACGVTERSAREKLAIAHALEKLPCVSAAMANGYLSYSKARLLVRIATPENERELVEMALHGTAYHVQVIVRAYRSATEAQELARESIQHARRNVIYWHDADGSLQVKARLPADCGALFIAALEAAAEATAKEPGADGEPIDNLSARRADALAAMSGDYLGGSGGVGTAGDRHQVMVHVAAETLLHNEPGQCELDRGPSLAGETVRRLACDSSVIRVIENARGEPLDIGRRARTISAAIKRALYIRDRGRCTWPGCARQRWLSAHHIRHWALGGETKLSNLALVCAVHHRALHEGGFGIRILEGGTLEFVRPDGQALLSEPPQVGGDVGKLRLGNDEGGVVIDEETAVSKWSGERLDASIAVSVLTRSR